MSEVLRSGTSARSSKSQEEYIISEARGCIFCAATRIYLVEQHQDAHERESLWTSYRLRTL